MSVKCQNIWHNMYSMHTYPSVHVIYMMCRVYIRIYSNMTCRPCWCVWWRCVDFHFSVVTYNTETFLLFPRTFTSTENPPACLMTSSPVSFFLSPSHASHASHASHPLSLPLFLTLFLFLLPVTPSIPLLHKRFKTGSTCTSSCRLSVFGCFWQFHCFPSVLQRVSAFP